MPTPTSTPTEQMDATAAAARDKVAAEIRGAKSLLQVYQRAQAICVRPGLAVIDPLFQAAYRAGWIVENILYAVHTCRLCAAADHMLAHSDPAEIVLRLERETDGSGGEVARWLNRMVAPDETESGLEALLTISRDGVVVSRSICLRPSEAVDEAAQRFFDIEVPHAQRRLWVQVGDENGKIASREFDADRTTGRGAAR